MRRFVARISHRTLASFLHTRPRCKFGSSEIMSTVARTQSRAGIQTTTWSRGKYIYPPLSADSPEKSYDDEANWAIALSSEGGAGIGPTGEASCAGFLAYRCTYANCPDARWEDFKIAFEKLMLMQWEDDASRGYDPDEMRKFFKIFWVEDKEELEGKTMADHQMFTRKFNNFIDTRRHPHDFNPCMNVFLLVTEDVIASLLEGPTKSEIPFVYAISGGAEEDGLRVDVDDEAGDESMFSDERYKIAIELLGEFWCIIGTGMRGMDSYTPSEVGGIRKMLSDSFLWETPEELAIKERLLK
ncbi:hypothetical protein BDZ45DRAFT_730817 [Acephala macrosclerotiorum]|nr:hypothetical protein BDZ45DRAFT_730817 [Acephala macrosclerotiorum]